MLNVLFIYLIPLRTDFSFPFNVLDSYSGDLSYGIMFLCGVISTAI